MIGLIARLIPQWLAWGAAGLVTLMLAFGGGYVKGRSDGRAIAAKASLQATLNQLKERGATDAQINDMGTADLCRLLGGVYVNGKCD